MPLSFLATWERYSAVWSTHYLARLAVLVERVQFDGPGNDTPMRDYCVVDISRSPLAERPTVEWWLRAPPGAVTGGG